MKSLNFKEMITRIKEDFSSRLISQRLNSLPVEEVAQLLYKYIKQQPLALKEVLLKSTGKLSLNWDDLLQYLQEDLSVYQAVKKIEHSPLYATEIMERHVNQFSKIIHFIKEKQTNAVQYMAYLPFEIYGSNVVVICFERELVFFDYQEGIIINNLQFKYTHVKQKLWQKQQQKRIQKEKEAYLKEQQLSDKVEEIVNKDLGRIHNKNVNFLTNNIKNSVRGSSISSEKSNDRNFLRRLNTEENKKRTNVIKIKNDDIKKIWQLFEKASVNNSINIANAFINSRNTFQKNILLDKSMLIQEKRETLFDPSSVMIHRNFNKELQGMRQTKKQLSKINQSSSVDFKNNKIRYRKQSLSYKQDKIEQETALFLKQKKQSMPSALDMSNKYLQIVSFHIFEHYLIISLFNRQIRLFNLKKTLSRITQEPIFEKNYKEVISFVHLFRSLNNFKLHLAAAIEKGNQTEFVVYHMDQQARINIKAFSYEFNFSAKCQCILPFGIVLYDQMGHFSLIQLNNSLSLVQQKLALNTQLFNPEKNYRISINQVRMNRNLINLYIGCAHGYVYQYDRYLKSIKYYIKICQSPVLDISLIKEDNELIALYGNGNLAILSSSHLEKIYVYHSSEEIQIESKIFIGLENIFYVYSKRRIIPFSFNENQQKHFNNTKPIKILKSRIKLKQKDKIQYPSQKSKVLKIIQGNGGRGDFLSLILQHGQILIFNSQLEYIGSYHFFMVHSIIGLACNECQQFLAVVLDNSFQVINLYTQNIMFSVNNSQIDKEMKHSRESTSLSIDKPKAKYKNINTIKHISFINQPKSIIFLSIVTQNHQVFNYSEKGILLMSVNLQESCGDIPSKTLMIYQQQQLVMTNRGSIMVLHRKSYNRKCLFKVSESDLISVRQTSNNQFTLCALDSQNNIFSIDINLRQAKIIHRDLDPMIPQSCLFNQKILVKYHQQKIIIQLLDQRQTFEIEILSSNYLLALIEKNIVKVNKLTGKVAKMNLVTTEFEDYVL